MRAAAVLLGLSALLGQPMAQEPVAVLVPTATPAAVGERLAAWFGDGVDVRAVDRPDGDGVLLLWDEWTLARAAADGALVLALPFADEVVVAVDAALFADGTVAPTWDSVALAPALHDRLGLADADVDGTVWLAALQERLERGDGEDAGVALWTTLDARAGTLCGSAAEVRDGLVAGRFAAALGPRGWFADLPARAGGALRREPLPGPRVRRGVAVTAAAGERARTLATALLVPDRRAALATAARLDVAAVTAPVLGPISARRWWQRFEVQVRGRGRAVEDLADWLDLVFGVGFVVVALVLWRVLRRTPEP